MHYAPPVEGNTCSSTREGASVCGGETPGERRPYALALRRGMGKDEWDRMSRLRLFIGVGVVLVVGGASVIALAADESGETSTSRSARESEAASTHSAADRFSVLQPATEARMNAVPA